jgi:hypothetical protein
MRSDAGEDQLARIERCLDHGRSGWPTRTLRSERALTLEMQRIDEPAAVEGGRLAKVRGRRFFTARNNEIIKKKCAEIFSLHTLCLPSARGGVKTKWSYHFGWRGFALGRAPAWRVRSGERGRAISYLGSSRPLSSIWHARRTCQRGWRDLLVRRLRGAAR